MIRDVAPAYIRDNFEASDRLAVVLINKRTNSVIQRIATAERIASPDFQAWLRRQNVQRYEVYISMNALRLEAKGRTKADVAEIRHLYLDFDEGGTEAVQRLLRRQDLPKPNSLINSSPDKWQVIWKVEGFGKGQAEALQRALARELGADPAATDCARVLRLPGFYNYKYGKPHRTGVESLARDTYHPEQFPKLAEEERYRPSGVMRNVPRGTRAGITQSERDWAYAKRALARVDSPTLVAAAIASYRRYDKHDPRYYAELTVRKASAALAADRMQELGPHRR